MFPGPKQTVDLRAALQAQPVLPIITLPSVDAAVPLARALAAAGLHVFEIVLRTPAALSGIEAIRRAVPQAVIGAGTLLTPADVQRAVDAGAMFGVTPGFAEDTGQAARDAQLPLLPGVWTASEVMQALRLGFDNLKLFPANGLQGAAQIGHLQSVFPQVRFCPTGGIKPEDIPSYLALPGCLSVGGSWVTPADRLASGDWAGITALAQRAMAFARGPAASATP